MFTRCSVCDYLKLLIEQTPRDQCALRERLKDRLGLHFDFQAAQRLALGRVHEHCSSWRWRCDGARAGDGLSQGGARSG